MTSGWRKEEEEEEEEEDEELSVVTVELSGALKSKSDVSESVGPQFMLRLMLILMLFHDRGLHGFKACMVNDHNI